MGTTASILPHGGGSTVRAGESVAVQSEVQLINSIIHGECCDMSELFANEVAAFHRNEITEEELKTRIAAILHSKRAAVVEKVRNFQPSDELYINAVREANLRLTTKNSHCFLVGVDGSLLSEIGFRVTLSLRRKSDDVVVFYTFRKYDDETLGYEYRSNVIRNKFGTILSEEVPSSHYHLSIIEREGEQTAKQFMRELITLCQQSQSQPSPVLRSIIGPFLPDFIVLGFTGKKSEMENRRYLGSKVAMVLSSFHLPVIIAKRAIENSHNKFALLVDDSRSSKIGFDLLLTLISHRDELVILHVHDQGTSAQANEVAMQTRDHYTAEINKARLLNAQFILTPIIEGKSLLDCILTCLNQQINADFVVMAPRAQQQVTDMTEKIILNTASNVIVFKA